MERQAAVLSKGVWQGLIANKSETNDLHEKCCFGLITTESEEKDIIKCMTSECHTDSAN